VRAALRRRAVKRRREGVVRVIEGRGEEREGVGLDLLD